MLVAATARRVQYLLVAAQERARRRPGPYARENDGGSLAYSLDPAGVVDQAHVHVRPAKVIGPNLTHLVLHESLEE
jgi:hypothetical protein